jgi:hypothetical protein
MDNIAADKWAGMEDMDPREVYSNHSNTAILIGILTAMKGCMPADHMDKAIVHLTEEVAMELSIVPAAVNLVTLAI